MDKTDKSFFAFFARSFGNVFAPKINKDPEEFYSEVEMIGYEFNVGLDRYRIEIRRDETGKFVPTDIYEAED